MGSKLAQFIHRYPVERLDACQTSEERAEVPCLCHQKTFGANTDEMMEKLKTSGEGRWLLVWPTGEFAWAEYELQRQDAVELGAVPIEAHEGSRLWLTARMRFEKEYA